MIFSGHKFVQAALFISTIPSCLCMSTYLRHLLREESQQMFHHGYDSYMKHAYPDDEIKPLTCESHTRDTDPGNFGVNDVLGNYSVTAIDSLSTLAILSHTSNHSLTTFWATVEDLVGLYWPDGFDRDSKVQVFETTIRGVGGLVSAHEFATGILPMAGQPRVGNNGWKYNDELLFLAHDLAARLLPAFDTPTGIPYPRVNLRHGSVNMPLSKNTGKKFVGDETDDERTDTCSAGSGSLTLEFTVLSRLLAEYKQTHEIVMKGSAKHAWDDVGIFEEVSQTAFWAIWDRRSRFDLIGAGIDAVTGLWDRSALAGIGASTDSFFEYALKTYILLSSSPVPPYNVNTLWSPDDYLDAFTTSVEAINRHILIDSPATWYQGVNMNTGSPIGGWVDSLSAFWPGLLVLSGDVKGAERACLFYTALWQRYHALPERYSPLQHTIYLQWWPGRPEFIESVYHLYRATKDIWYLRVGEMVLRDIQRRCWGKCGWASLHDVRTGELSDRMESFLLTETLGYLYLLFDDEHPLHSGDQPWVFTTEGHPVVMPQTRYKTKVSDYKEMAPKCQNPLYNSSQDIYSKTASRTDIFHSYELLRLHLLPSTTVTPRTPTILKFINNNNVTEEFGYFNHLDESNPHRFDELYSPTNNSFYPWTLPEEIVSPNAYCVPPPGLDGFELIFPTSTEKQGIQVKKIPAGILIQSLNGLRLGFVKEIAYGSKSRQQYRVRKVGGYITGKDEMIVIGMDLLQGMGAGEGLDFTFVKEEDVFDVVVEYSSLDSMMKPTIEVNLENSLGKDSGMNVLEHLQELITNLANNQFLDSSSKSKSPKTLRRHLQAIPASGIGSILPTSDIFEDLGKDFLKTSLYKSVYPAGLACDEFLPMESKEYEIILLKRGICSFATKLNNIRTSSTTKLAIVVSYEDTPRSSMYDGMYAEEFGADDFYSHSDSYLIRPLVDQMQTEPPAGKRRVKKLPLILVGGGERTYEVLREASGIGIRERYKVELGKTILANMAVI